MILRSMIIHPPHRIPTWVAPLAIAALICAVASSATAGEMDGRWRLVSQRVDVTVLSWGQDCGPRPESMSSSRVQYVKVTDTGANLAIAGEGEKVSTGGCWSPNPRLQVQKNKKETNRWFTVCETPKDDARSERGTYELTIVNADRMDMNAESHYDWRLKGDHCEAKVVETRLYLRANDLTIDRTLDFDEEMMPSSSKAPEKSEEKIQSCPDPGEPVQIVIRPRRTQLRPGDRVCLEAYGVDAKGCHKPVDAIFSAFLGGRPAPERLSGGCFTAGDTAAEGEGLYRITAQRSGMKAVADIDVRFPNISDLVSAKLDPKNEIAEPQSAPAIEPGKPIPAGRPTMLAPVAVPSKSGPVTPEWKKWVLAGSAVFLLMAAVVAITLFIVSRRARAMAAAREEEKPEESADGQAEAAYYGRSAVCPTCERELPAGSRFCPHDATSLVYLKPDGIPASMKEDKICPKCHRRFEPDKVVCSHDGEDLMFYSNWLSRHGPHAADPKGKGKICPVCATKYESSATFCGKDGSALVTLN